MRTRRRHLCWALVAVLITAGCAPGYYTQGRRLAEEQRFDEAIDSYYQEIAADPASARAWREIGVTRYQQGDLHAAEEALKQANRIEPDARTHLYLGLIHERNQDLDLAVRSFRAALGLDPPRQTRKIVEGYLNVLVRRQVEEDVKRALAAEAEIDPASIPANTIAVVEFDGSQLPPELAPLSLGLTDFTSLDLAKVGSLQVVDRLKIDAVQQELALGQSELVDPATAPRIGHLVGGRRIVTGSVLALGDERIRLSGAVVDAVERTTEFPEDTDGELIEFFRVQKDFVFRVIDELGITLTPEERAAIQEVPTESYLAFMAYCRGLDHSQAGRYPEAQAEFRSATQTDGGFTQAAQQGKSLSAQLAAGFTGGGLDGGRFAAEVAEVAETELLGDPLGKFQAAALRLQNFVPLAGEVDLLGGVIADSPPRTGDIGSATILIRGNLDGGVEMRKLLSLALTVVVAGALAPAASAQILYGQPSSGNVGLVYTHWKLDGLGTSGTLDQWVVPVNGFVPIRDDMEARFYIAHASNTLKEETGEHKLNGLTDMRLQVNHSFSRDRYLLSAGLNLPTGKTGLNLSSEWLVMNVLTQNFLAFPVRRLGEGFGLNLMGGAATTWGRNRVGASASYNYTGSYEAYAGEGQYNPGNSLLLTAGIQGDRADWIWRGNLSFTTHAVDKQEGRKVYGQGDAFGIHAGGGLNREDLRATVDLRYLIRGRNELYDPTASLASRLKVYGNEFGVGGKLAWVKPSGLNYGPLLELRFIQGNEFDFGASQIFGLGGVAGYPLGRQLILDGMLRFYTGNTDDGDIDLSGYQFSLSLSGHL